MRTNKANEQIVEKARATKAPLDIRRPNEFYTASAGKTYSPQETWWFGKIPSISATIHAIKIL